MKTPINYFLLIVLVLLSCVKPSDPAKEEWLQLFNNKDLTGWDIKIAGHDLNENFNNTFYVQDSILKVDYSRYQKFNGDFGHLYYKEPFSYYKLKIEYRFTGHQLEGGPDFAYLNSGVMLHSQPANSLAKAQSFPVSLEMQFLASDSVSQRHSGNLCTPGTQVSRKGVLVESHCIDSQSESYDADRWVTAEAIVLGDSIIHHLIEGDTVLTYEQLRIGGGFVNKTYGWESAGILDSLQWIQKEGTPLREGYIALQAESHPIEFRKVELLNLKGCTDPKAKNYKAYFIKSDNSTCRYK